MVPSSLPRAPAALEALNGYLQDFCAEKGVTYAKIKCPAENLARYFNVRGMTVDTSSGSMNLDLEKNPSDFIWNEFFTQKTSFKNHT